MLSKIRALKEKKGFTLVELIVVLVILAILAALLVPALTGYIDKANEKKIIATTRQVVMAAQADVSEAYGKASGAKLGGGDNVNIMDPAAADVDGIKPVEIGVLAEVVTKTAGTTTTYTPKSGITATVSWDTAGHVTKVVLGQSGKTCTYTAGAADPYSVS